ncbi:MAG: HEAT repeat domain-containing protein, partial [Bradymonadia bacterium]
MTENKNTGAQDWRSELEKRKSLLRKSAIALFKTWIPDHAEASLARGEVYSLFQASLHQYANAVTFVNQLSFGSEDIAAHEFASDPISLQELLVQREGTDAFLDAKNALRVVRRKFGMMTLISRMASTMEQRNIASVRVSGEIDQETLLKFGKLMSRRVDGTSTEEEEEFRRQLRRLNSKHIDVLFHVDVVGRKVAVPWLVKEIYSRLAIVNKREGSVNADRLQQFCSEQANRLNSKAVRQLSLYSKEMRQDLGDTLRDPFPELLKAANERLVLTATRNLFDEFNELRTLRKQREALNQSGEHNLTPEVTEELLDEEQTDFTSAASELGGDESVELVRLGKALDLIREVKGRAFFVRISMVSGDLNFADTASGKTESSGQFEADTMTNPVEALRRARAVSEPLYRCQYLGTVTPTLVSAGRFDDAMAAASESLDSARLVPNEDKVSAYSVAVRALIETEQPELAALAATEAINCAHNTRDLVERSGALVRIASTLIETGTLPIAVKRAASRTILGPDVYFWGKPAVKSTLVEAVIAVLSSKEDDSLIFLQKVIVHSDPAVRCSVIRTMPLDGITHLEKMLVGHLKDRDPNVRLEVIERLGSSSQVKFAVYLANAIRQGEFSSDEEKRALALNLGRLDPLRQYHVYNAML